MPFCIACGNEIDTDQKFCDYCGAAQDQSSSGASRQVLSPPPPPPAVTPPPVSSSPFSRDRKIPVKMNHGIIVGIVVAVIVIAGSILIWIPSLKEIPSSHAADAMPSPPTITAVPTQIVPTTIPMTPVLKRADQYEETYEQIYTSNRSYKFGQTETVSHDLVRPPLYVRFNVTPGMVVREKLVDIGLPSEHNMTVMYVNPNAWFEVKVIDSGDGTVVEKRGFNKDYSQITRQEFMVRTKGTYRIEMSGNDVFVEAQILTGD